MPIREIEPEFHERLGHIVTSWAVIESLQAEFLAHLLQADPGSMYIMTQNVSARTVTGWIRTMTPIHLSDQESQQRIADLLTKIDEVRADRNALVHGLWSTESTAGTVLVQTVRWERAEIVKGEIWTLADLDELIDSLLPLREELHFLVKRFVEIRGL